MLIRNEKDDSNIYTKLINFSFCILSSTSRELHGFVVRSHACLSIFVCFTCINRLHPLPVGLVIA